jgi:predicted acyltransferase
VLVRRRKHHDSGPFGPLSPDDHIASLDAFRGVAVAGMILVDNPGNWNNVLQSLTHADWNGCTIADLVFPLFIFILGAAMPFAFARRLARGHQDRQLFGRIARRTAWLVGLGLVLNVVAALPAPFAFRLPGVLQRIALVYLVAAPIVLRVGMLGRAVILIALALVHWVLLIVGTHGAGLSPSHNLSAAIDKAIFGAHTLTTSGDPEGVLGTLPAISTALLGSIAGECLQRASVPSVGVRRLAVIGVASSVAGLMWASVLPFNKTLWTGSFALWTGGLAALMLALCYWVMDVRGFRGWARPFLWLGFNPLAIYFLSELVSHMFDKPWLHIGGQTLTIRSWLFWDVWQPWMPSLGEEWVSLLAAILTVLVWAALAGLLYRREIRLQV